MKDRSKIEEFLKDLSLTVPYIQSYQMIDWFLFVFYILSLIWILRNRLQGLFLLSILDFCWSAYYLDYCEYAGALLFLIYGLLTAWSCLEQHWKNKQPPKSLF